MNYVLVFGELLSVIVLIFFFGISFLLFLIFKSLAHRELKQMDVVLNDDFKIVKNEDNSLLTIVMFLNCKY